MKKIPKLGDALQELLAAENAVLDPEDAQNLSEVLEENLPEVYREAPRMLDVLWYVARGPSFRQPHGITAYAISDEVIDEARALVAGLAGDDYVPFKDR